MAEQDDGRASEGGMTYRWKAIIIAGVVGIGLPLLFGPGGSCAGAIYATAIMLASSG